MSGPGAPARPHLRDRSGQRAARTRDRGDHPRSGPARGDRVRGLAERDLDERGPRGGSRDRRRRGRRRRRRGHLRAQRRVVHRGDGRASALETRADRAEAPARGAVRRGARGPPLRAPQPAAADRARAHGQLRAPRERRLGAAAALRPRQLGLGAAGYGVLLGFFGLGAVSGGLLLPRLRQWLGIERLATGAALLFAASLLALDLLPALAPAAASLFLAGAPGSRCSRR